MVGRVAWLYIFCGSAVANEACVGGADVASEERTSLLQRHVSPLALQASPSRSMNATDLLESYKKVTDSLMRRSQNSAEERETGVLDLVEGLNSAVDSFREGLLSEHEDAQAIVDASLRVVEEHVVDAGQLDAAEIAQLEPQLEAARAASEACHASKDTAISHETATCGTLQNHVQRLNGQCTAGCAAGCGTEVDFFSNFDGWKTLIEVEGASLIAERNACDEARRAVESSTAECATLDEELLEAQSGLDAHRLRCSAYDTSVSSFQETLEHVRNQVHSMQADYAVLEHVQCIHQVCVTVLAREGDNNLTPEELQTCADDAAYEAAALEALPVPLLEIPDNPSCGGGSGGTTTTTTTAESSWFLGTGADQYPYQLNCNVVCRAHGKTCTPDMQNTITRAAMEAYAHEVGVECTEYGTTGWAPFIYFRDSDTINCYHLRDGGSAGCRDNVGAGANFVLCHCH